MRSKAPLAMIEQTVMVLVFALAAALCLQVFVWCDRQSRDSAARDQAVLCAQSAAEVLKHCRGDLTQARAALGGSLDEDSWSIGYDSLWSPVQEGASYLLTASPGDSGYPLLGQALVSVSRADDGTQLFQLTVNWQEVTPHGG